MKPTKKFYNEFCLKVLGKKPTEFHDYGSGVLSAVVEMGLFRYDLYPRNGSIAITIFDYGTCISTRYYKIDGTSDDYQQEKWNDEIKKEITDNYKEWLQYKMEKDGRQKFCDFLEVL